jgi:hypothetical protein
MNNLRFALRQLRKSPGFAAVAILTPRHETDPMLALRYE